MWERRKELGVEEMNPYRMTTGQILRKYFKWWMLFPAPLFLLSIWAGVYMTNLVFSTEGDLMGGTYAED